MYLPSFLAQAAFANQLKSGELTICRGTVVMAYGGLNSYLVFSDMGSKLSVASAHGVSRGSPGVSEAGGYSPGQTVILGILKNSNQIFIIGASGDRTFDRDANLFGQDTVGWPRLTGYQYEKRLWGKVRKEELIRNTVNFNGSAPPDLADGEWGMMSPFGAGVAVEHFRAYLRGAPFAKVECYGEEQPMVRIAGERLEVQSLHREAEDGVLYNTAQHIDRRVLYPSEALQDWPARILNVGGQAHAGDHSYYVQQNPTVEDPPRRKLGLLHEMRGYTGEYLLEAARSITLRKTCNIVVPDEKRPELGDALAPQRQEEGENTVSNPAEFIEVEDNQRAEILPAKDPAVTTDDYVPEQHWPLHHIARIFEYVENLNWRGRNVATRLDKKWAVGVAPSELEGVPQTPQHNPSVMWHIAPQQIVMGVDQRIGDRRFYVGTSVITMTEDGAIVLEDAYHSQIVMAKGNIRISAAKELILESGRNTIVVSSDNLCLRGHNHIDLASNTGRVHIKAEQQLDLLGGNGGTGGVQIESRATAPSPSEGSGASQTSGGVAVLSATAFTVASPLVFISAADKDEQRGSVVLSGAADVSVQTRRMSARFGAELGMAFGTEKGAVIGADQTVLHGLVADTVCDLSDGGDSDAIRYVNENTPQLVASILQTVSVLGAWTRPYDWEALGMQFCSTDDLGLSSPVSFALPEASWQRHLAATGVQPTWHESLVVEPRTGSMSCPFPGLAAWVQEDRLLQFPSGDFYNPLSGVHATSLDEKQLLDDTDNYAPSSCTMPLTTTVTISSNYIRGTDA